MRGNLFLFLWVSSITVLLSLSRSEEMSSPGKELNSVGEEEKRRALCDWRLLRVMKSVCVKKKRAEGPDRR